MGRWGYESLFCLCVFLVVKRQLMTVPNYSLLNKESHAWEQMVPPCLDPFLSLYRGSVCFFEDTITWQCCTIACPMFLGQVRTLLDQPKFIWRKPQTRALHKNVRIHILRVARSLILNFSVMSGRVWQLSRNQLCLIWSTTKAYLTSLIRTTNLYSTSMAIKAPLTLSALADAITLGQTKFTITFSYLHSSYYLRSAYSEKKNFKGSIFSSNDCLSISYTIRIWWMSTINFSVKMVM